MKRIDLIRMFKRNNWYFLRHGGEHDVYTDGIHTETVPRHREINEKLARAIIRRWGLK